MSGPILPGATLGVMGGGQLGRMFALAARRMGYRVHVFSPERDGPAAQVADFSTVGAYADEAAVRRFASEIDVLTFEFENIPALTVEWCGKSVEARPSGFILHTAQHRLREKDFLAAHGIPVAPYRAVMSEDALEQALRELGGEGVVKSAAFGYDGKGQRKIAPDDRVAEIWKERPGDELILEGLVDFERELSVIVARNSAGELAAFPVCENLHAHHILDLTVVPARISRAVSTEAVSLAQTIAEKLQLVGLLTVEMFLGSDGRLLVNELAPRPHNSGHWTIEGCMTSQFEQHVRAICGLPLGATDLLCPAAMVNLLGDVWAEGEPDWAAALRVSGTHLHLYGKAEPRPGRKMGHITVLASGADEAICGARAARAALVGG